MNVEHESEGQPHADKFHLGESTTEPRSSGDCEKMYAHESENLLPQERFPSRRRPGFWLQALTFLGGWLFGMTTLAAIIKISSYRQHQQQTVPLLEWSSEADPEPVLHKSCGSTPAEARAAGCVFDMLTTAWTPAECADLEVTEEWLTEVLDSYDWPYFLDANGTTKQTDLTLLRSGEWSGELWSTMGLHKLHCLYVWRRFHMANLGGKALDTVLRGPRHSRHCAKMMMMMDASQNEVTGVQSVFYREC